MTIYQVLCLIGVPALILAVFKYLWSQIKHNTEDSKALKAGIQALLRAQMISDFNKYSEKGYAPIYARDNFENCWKQYHSLGDRKSTRLNSSHNNQSRMPSSA